MRYATFDKLALRSAAAIILAISLGATIFVQITTRTIENKMRDDLHFIHQSLISTIESTARTAVFVKDKKLANDIVGGLAKAKLVAYASLSEGDNLLAEKANIDISSRFGLTQHSRILFSPFDDQEQIGEIRLVTDDSALKREIQKASKLATRYQITVVGILIFLVIFTIQIIVVRPITRLSNKLHRLRVETGQKLIPEKGHQGDELGCLVQDINRLIEHLVSYINQERSLRNAKEASEERLRNIFDNAQSGFASFSPACELLSTNLLFREYFLPGQKQDKDVPHHLTGVDKNVKETLESLVQEALSRTRPRRAQLTLPYNRNRWIEVVATPSQNGNVDMVCNDITELKAASFRAENIASTDSLTGLGNRLGFEQHIKTLTSDNQMRSNGTFALIYLDLDHFKEVNDTFGHSAGDEVLKLVSQILQTITRQSDYIARLGGDEFVIILENVSSATVATGIAATLLEKLRAPLHIPGGNRAKIGASIGITFGLSGVDDPNALVDQADKAMYQAKQKGRNCYYLAQEGLTKI